MAKVSIGFDCVLDLPSAEEILGERGLGKGGTVQKLIDAEIIRRCDPKVPFRTGALKDSAQTSTAIGSGVIVYNTPYARRMFYNPQYHFNGAPERGAFWAQRMWAEDGDDIVRMAAEAAGGHVG